jgi:hypothetical protein
VTNLRATLAIMGLACGLGGCGPASRSLVVAVRDAQTHAPVVGAGVEADSLALGTSLEVSDLLDEVMGRRGVLESKGITDARGEAHVKYSPGRSVRVVVLLIDGPPATLLIQHDFELGPTGWEVPEQFADKAATVEVRAGKE